MATVSRGVYLHSGGLLYLLLQICTTYHNEVILLQVDFSLPLGATNAIATSQKFRLLHSTLVAVGWRILLLFGKKEGSALSGRGSWCQCDIEILLPVILTLLLSGN